MEFSPVDFLIGATLMNAMPHMLFGLMKVRFFSVFGYSPPGNIGYAFLNIAIALALFHINYGLAALRQNEIVIGALAMLAIYLISGRFFLALFSKSEH